MSLRAEVLRLGIRWFMKRGGRHLDVEGWRRDMQKMERLVPRPPARCTTREVRVGRLNLIQVTTPASRPDRNLLYLHGGAYISGAPAHYRHFTWRIADAAAAAVWVLDYRLAPEHPFPAAVDDAVEAHSFLADRTPPDGELLAMGDSAGGGLVLALLLKLRDDGERLPSAVVALSPWTDLALTGKSLFSNAAADPMLNADDLPALAECYLAGADPYTPYASPLYGDPTGLPPVLILVGSDEILRDDAERMAARLRDANPGSKLEVWSRMPHVWPLFVPAMPEAHRAIRRIRDFFAGALH